MGAHCMNDKHPDVVALGEHSLGSTCDCDVLEGDSEKSCNEPTQIIDVEKVIVHERYRKDSWHTSNDIALIRLAKPVDISVNVIPICLPLNKRTAADNIGVSSMNPAVMARELKPKNKKALVAGWGRTNNKRENSKNQAETGASSDDLKHVALPLYEKCDDVFRQAKINEQKQICAGGVRGYDS